jgi:hypothetical protein
MKVLAGMADRRSGRGGEVRDRTTAMADVYRTEGAFDREQSEKVGMAFAG